MALFFVLLLILSVIYTGNLNSGFILDDWPNLDHLNSVPDTVTILNLIEFIANNTSGQLGRPVSLLSFAIQSQHWPNNPAAFKAINLILHLINGGLIAWVCVLILQQFNNRLSEKIWLPVMVSGLWLVQPIHVSTVLYTVQRMTLLMACFSLLGLSGYLFGRKHCFTRPVTGYLISTVALIVCGLLAVFSKENGILLLLYIAVIELTLFSKQPIPKYWKTWRNCFIFIPILIGGSYALQNFQVFIGGHAGRNYTFIEHLLTESRILLDYINKIVLPRPNSFGLFFDDYTISTNILTPLSTLFSLLFISIVLITALMVKRKQPVFSFSVLWFFAGHSLESSFIPLELYFEHRNYLPAIGIIFGLCFYFLFFLQKASSSFVKYTFIAFALLYFTGISFICFKEAHLWGHPAQQALAWQSNHPRSKRANALAAQIWIDLNKPSKADQYLNNISSIDHKDSGSHLMRLELHCGINHLTSTDLSEILNRLQLADIENATILTAKSLVIRWKNQHCPSLRPDYIEQVLTTILSNTIYPKHKTHLVSTLSLFYAVQNKYTQAFQLLNQYIDEIPNATDLILLKIRWGIANQQYHQALNWINAAKTKKNISFLNNINFLNKLNILEKNIFSLQKQSATLK